MSREINIALLGDAFLGWGGGADFLRNCANALVLKKQHNHLNIYILIPENSLIKEIRIALLPYKTMAKDVLAMKRPRFLKSAQIDKTLLVYFLESLGPNINPVYYNNSDKGLISSLQEIKADLVFPCFDSPGASFPFPWIGYVYDFQHKYLEKFFTEKECVERDRINGRLVKDAKALIVNSKTVKDDLNIYYPDATCKVFSLPFAPVPNENWFDDNIADIRTKYCLPKRYFIISNQFWVHKSHATAFQALSRLKYMGVEDIHIVCTGKMEDYRFPRYLRDLQAMITELDLTDKIHFLGYISKNDQIQIMRQALAVLQPTLFEGGPGGGAVYDAVALGIPAIISDIPVNREIEDENIHFFSTGSAEDMAIKMFEFLVKPKLHLEPSQSWAKGQKRADRLGDCLLEAINFVVS